MDFKCNHFDNQNLHFAVSSKIFTITIDLVCLGQELYFLHFVRKCNVSTFFSFKT